MRRACLALLFCGVAAPGYSQSEDSIVVNAPRFTEDARRLPANVTVIGQDDIAKSTARTLPELLQEQVGITMKDFYGNNAALTSVDMRGFGVTGGQNTLILLDGRRFTDIDLSSPAVGVDPARRHRAHRNRARRGRGALRRRRYRGRDQHRHALAAQAGRRHRDLRPRRELRYPGGQVYGSYATGDLGINASAYGYSSDGYRANNRNEQTNYTANLRWAFGDTMLDLRLGSDNQDLRLPGARRVQPSIGLNEYAADPRGAQTPLDYASRDGSRAGVTLGATLGEAEMTLGLDWRNKKTNALFAQQFRTLQDRLTVKSFTPRLRLPFQLAAWATG